ncbi:MAG: hypothetical protein KDE27_31540 [Planctomycetes bacterium]|nr:hypothetical protein [Planctomycetota bacterium]
MLSHPLIVEAAETLFVPVAIKNNTEGDADAKVRERFGEAAWNNPVVRFVGPGARDLAPKLHADWTVTALATGMVEALGTSKRPVPDWLWLLAHEEQARRRGLERAVFAQA